MCILIANYTHSKFIQLGIHLTQLITKRKSCGAGTPCPRPVPPGRPTWRADEGVRRGPGGPPHKCAKQVLAESMDTQFYTNSRASTPNVLLSAMSTVSITGAGVAQKAHIEPSVLPKPCVVGWLWRKRA